MTTLDLDQDDHTAAQVDLGQSAVRISRAAALLLRYACRSRTWERNRAEIAEQIAEIRNALQPLVSWSELFERAERESLQGKADADADDQQGGGRTK